MDKQKMYDFVAQATGKCRLLVVGDVMLDKYYYGEVTRISPEAPVPVTRVLSQKETLGGAANVAHNLALLGCQTQIAGYVGDDYHCQSLTDKFTARGIDYRGLIHTDRPTTTKLRVIGGHQQMLRLDFEEADPMTGEYAQRLQNYVSTRLSEGVDGVIISDYGKGACTPETCQAVIKCCHAQGVPVVVDPKGTNWGKYSGADYITPNFKELNAVLPEKIKNQDAAIEQAARYVMGKFGIKQVLATRSEYGMSLVTKTEAKHIPTKAQEVFDVSGAGDTVIAVFTLGLAGGLAPEICAYMSNMAASVVVAKVGTYAVSKEELLAVLR
ncbi:MAG: D-glycero-beta-D-manno-heptose-7-phosphate kinase [Selenomonas sp.]|nr:D-glycero-beta-D-manno-heptose-7-phosphate kinase [Selenomonas sp.]MBQ5419263.1 D-glycero-beta-D-manno-heptose-7-phosphate kinase [Selenomonas sp.]